MNDKVGKYWTKASDGGPRNTLITLRLTAEEGLRLTQVATDARRPRADYARIAVMDCVAAAIVGDSVEDGSNG